MAVRDTWGNSFLSAWGNSLSVEIPASPWITQPVDTTSYAEQVRDSTSYTEQPKDNTVWTEQ